MRRVAYHAISVFMHHPVLLDWPIDGWLSLYYAHLVGKSSFESERGVWNIEELLTAAERATQRFNVRRFPLLRAVARPHVTPHSRNVIRRLRISGPNSTQTLIIFSSRVLEIASLRTRCETKESIYWVPFFH